MLSCTPAQHSRVSCNDDSSLLAFACSCRFRHATVIIARAAQESCNSAGAACTRSDAASVHCAQVLEATALDFSRYGDTLFEVLFAGGRLAAGGNVVEEGKKLDTNVRPPTPQLPCSAMCSAPRPGLGLRVGDSQSPRHQSRSASWQREHLGAESFSRLC